MTEKSALFEKVDAVTVPVPDLDAGLRFYAEALGHPLSWRNDDIGQAGLQLPGGDTELVLATDLRYEPNWLVDSADEAAERFRAAGGRVVHVPFDIPVGRAVVVADPFDNVLLLLDLSKGFYRVDDAGAVTGVGPASPPDRHGAPTAPGGGWMGGRTATAHAGFALDHLRPGMRLLDCGCGPGSITAGLADAVAPGHVVGLDRSLGQLTGARTLATAATFAAGDACHLPFADASFDAVFAHAVLWHVPEPALALAEFHRVLRPGGLVAVRDTDYLTWALEPATPSLDRFRELMLDLHRRRGKSVDHVSRQCALIAAAGFERVHAGASCVTNGTAGAVRRAAGAYLELLHGPEFGAVAGDEVARLDDELGAWAGRPDAFELLVWRSIVARKAGVPLRGSLPLH